MSIFSGVSGNISIAVTHDASDQESGHLPLCYLCSVSFLCSIINFYLHYYTMWVNARIFSHPSGHLGKFSTIFPNNLAVYNIL